MFDFIPAAYYADSFYYFNLIIVIGYAINLIRITYDKKKRGAGLPLLFLFIFVLLYIGTRPISHYFGDMITYANSFSSYVYQLEFRLSEDWLFERFMFESSKIMTVENWFLLCDFLYIFPIYIISKKLGNNYPSYLFLLFIVSFSFWSYGTNGIRNGMATSIFLLAFSTNKLPLQLCWIYLACGIHSSLILPSIAFILTIWFKNPKYYFLGWLASIPLSLMAGSYFQGVFSGLIDDKRTSYLAEGSADVNEFSSIGFRWDFLLYSAAPVYNAYYFIFKKKWNNPIYNRIVNIYLASNAFWILVIKANFSNRFAYLSWFMMALVVGYPWVQRQFIPKQIQSMAWILIVYFAFTFIMNVIIY